MIEAISSLPVDNSYYVGLMTFNKNVQVYELSSRINTVFCINGLKEYSVFDIMGLLGISVKNDPTHKSYDVFKRFIVPLGSKDDAQKICRRVRDIKKDSTITVN